MEERRRFEQYVEAHQKIVLEALKHISTTGYLSFQLDEEFRLIESSFQFVQGNFCRDEFTGVDNSNIKLPLETEIIDAFYLYFLVRSADNATTMKIRKLILLGKK